MSFTLEDGEAELQSSASRFYANNPNDPQSAYYVPPAGMMQNNAGQVVPISPAQTFASPTSTATPTTNSTPQQLTYDDLKNIAINGGQGKSLLDKAMEKAGFSLPSLEDTIFIIVGLILIGAGVFAFKQTQSVINIATGAAKGVGKIAAIAA